eukprot:jgi/Orpsp1_1/1178255/evm.model.c7180000064595.2
MKENKKQIIYSGKMSCQINDLFTTRGYPHEEKRLNNYNKFLNKYSKGIDYINDLLYMKKEEDVAVLPYKPEKVEYISRRFSIQFLTNHKYNFEQAFAVVTRCTLSKTGKNFRKVISKIKQDKKLTNNCSVILPEKSNSNEYIEFNLKTDPKLIYIILIKLSNGLIYLSQPITNRSFKHYTQREKDNLFDAYEKEGKIGMLYYHYNSIINENGLIKNPIYELDIYEIDFKNFDLINSSKSFSTDHLIEILKLMKTEKEKLIKRQEKILNKNSPLSNYYPPSPDNNIQTTDIN